MKMSKLVGRRTKETPKDAKTISHQFLIRGGYIRQVSTGIYSLLPLGKRVQDKVESIIREEMDALGSQEILMPLVNPADIWEESGRYNAIGEELLRFKDRNDKQMVLAMTHEEAVCHLARTELTSYKQLPAILYQIQTKYRDEARPRAGLIRVREFRMKDAYSFHETYECLENTYQHMHKAYENIFRRCGLHDCLSIQSDSGMIGGKVAHEFMAIAECGEDTLFVSSCGKYQANREVAVSPLKYKKASCGALEEVSTPDAKTIEDLAQFLKISPADTAKAVAYVDVKGQVYLAMIRGDIEINEVKLKKFIQQNELKFANDEQITQAGMVGGYMSCMGVNLKKVKVILDDSVAQSAPLVIGANKEGFHFKNFDAQRDIDISLCIVGDIRTVRNGDPCPITGTPLIEKRGIEVGNIFQLGTKYSTAMGVNYLDKNGKSQTTIMGCYGIGTGRTVASVIEQNYDDYGPIWPLSIAPYHVHICVLNPNQEGVGEQAKKLYHDLQKNGIEVLIDDRGEKAGFMFNDADLIGIPYRLILSPKSLANGEIEFKLRNNRDITLLKIENVVDFMTQTIKTELEKWK